MPSPDPFPKGCSTCLIPPHLRQIQSSLYLHEFLSSLPCSIPYFLPVMTENLRGAWNHMRFRQFKRDNKLKDSEQPPILSVALTLHHVIWKLNFDFTSHSLLHGGFSWLHYFVKKCVLIAQTILLLLNFTF